MLNYPKEGAFKRTLIKCNQPENAMENLIILHCLFGDLMQIHTL